MSFSNIYKRATTNLLSSTLLCATFALAGATWDQGTAYAAGPNAANTNHAKNTKIIFGQKMKPVKSFAADSSAGKHIDLQWQYNRQQTTKDDKKILKCLNGEDSSFCTRAKPLTKWMMSLRHSPLNEKILETQSAVNALMSYKSDAHIYNKLEKSGYAAKDKGRFDYTNKTGKDDIYLSYIESYILREGDCDDYAIAKYDLLLRLGVPPEKMMVVMGLDEHPAEKVDVNGQPVNNSQNRKIKMNGKQYIAHAVLVVENEAGKKLVLDNGKNADMYLADASYNFIPLYGVNSNTSWQAYGDTPHNLVNILRTKIGAKEQAQQVTTAAAQLHPSAQP